MPNSCCPEESVLIRDRKCFQIMKMAHIIKHHPNHDWPRQVNIHDDDQLAIFSSQAQRGNGKLCKFDTSVFIRPLSNSIVEPIYFTFKVFNWIYQSDPEIQCDFQAVDETRRVYQ